MLVVDRFEGDYAVCECEDGTTLHVARKLIAGEAREGSALDPWDGGFRVNGPRTRAARERIRGKVQRLIDGSGPDQTT